MNTTETQANKTTIDVTQWEKITQRLVTKPVDNIITGTMEHQTGLGTRCVWLRRDLSLQQPNHL